jgi:outer membrane protein assembly factor BamB
LTDPKRIGKRLRFACLAAILAIAIAFFLLVDAQLSFSGRPSVDMLILLAVTNLAVYVWIRLASGWQPRTHAKIILCLIVLQTILFATVQMEGIRGNGRPVFSWRWAPLPADDYVEPASAEQTVAEVASQADAVWPQFRGTNRDGKSFETVANWKTSAPTLMWKQPIGSGWSSFVVVGSWCFTQEQRSSQECLVCYEIETGKQVWCNSSVERFSEITGGEGPRATPAYDNGFLYALGATGILKCVDARDGVTKWETDILIDHDAQNCYFGMCASPLIANEKVIVSPGGENSSLVAYDKNDGNVIWKSGSADASYSSPVRMTIAETDQILIFNGDGLYAHETETGKVLWQVDWISNEEEKNNVCQPIQLSDSDIFISSGYGMGCARFRIENTDGQLSAEVVWKNKNLKSKFSSAILHKDHIYGLDLGIMTCVDAETGKRQWKEGRYAHGQFIQAGNFFIVQSEKGYLAQVAVDPTAFRETGRLKALKHRTWTHPTLADGVLLIRNDREMAAIRLK